MQSKIVGWALFAIIVNLAVFSSSSLAYLTWWARRRNQIYFLFTRAEVFRQRADRAELIAERERRWVLPIGLLLANGIALLALIETINSHR